LKLALRIGFGVTSGYSPGGTTAKSLIAEIENSYPDLVVTIKLIFSFDKPVESVTPFVA